MTPIKIAGIAALLFGAMLAPTVTQAAQATASVNVRSGPGTSYSVVDVLQVGESVGVDHCVSSGWCYIIKSGRDGWVSARYLTNDDEDFVDRPSRPDTRPDISLGFGVPGFSIIIGDGGFGFRPVRPDTRALACFYEDVNYHGSRFCARPGESIRRLGAWNDRISSIRISGGAEALVCKDVGFSGRCVVVDHSVSNLGPRGNDVISSIRVR